MYAKSSVVVPFRGAEQPPVETPEMVRRLTAVEAVHAALLALAHGDHEAPVRLALSQPRPDVTVLMLEAMPDDITPDEVMDYAATHANAAKLEMVYELYRDRLRLWDDHVDALLGRKDAEAPALLAAFMPRFLPRLKRLQELLEKLTARGDVALFGQIARECDVEQIDDAETLVSDAAYRAESLTRKSAPATRKAAADLIRAARRLRQRVVLHQQAP